jgi:hypothetical protein
MMTEQTISRESLDLINNAIIRDTFLTQETVKKEETVKDLQKEEQIASLQKDLQKEPIIKQTNKDDSCCCSDNCFKWWFFHSSFQATRQSIIEESLLKKTQSCVCCNICGDCVELKIKNCCITNSISEPFVKEYCSDCFYNGCQIICCCFTIVLASN